MPGTPTYHVRPRGHHAGADLRLAFLLLRFLFSAGLPAIPEGEQEEVAAILVEGRAAERSLTPEQTIFAQGFRAGLRHARESLLEATGRLGMQE